MTNMISRVNTPAYLLPTVFGLDMFDKMIEEFDNVDKFFNMPTASYPTDVVEIRDEDGKVIGNEINITLAGIPKECINIEVVDDTLTIDVKKVDELVDESRSYLHKGISKRAASFRYGLRNIDKENIKCTFVDGLLKVDLPLLAPAKRSIKIN